MFNNSRKLVKLAASTTVGFCSAAVTRRLIDIVFEDEELTPLQNVEYTVGSIAIGGVVAEATSQYTNAFVDEVYDLNDSFKKAVVEKKNSRTK